jgi:hypothetical protein
MKIAVLACFGEDPHFIDHLGYLAHLFDAPLIVAHETLFEQVKKYYPFISNCYQIKETETSVGSLLQEYEVFFSSHYLALKKWPLQRKENGTPAIRTIYCSHGYSDKGHDSRVMEHFSYEDLCFVYGKKMKRFLHLKGVEDQGNWITVGNYRYAYYKKFQQFFDHLVQEKVFSNLDPRLPTVLYAPTWRDIEGSSSFPGVCSHLCKDFTDPWNLIVKWHPSLKRDHFTEVSYWEECFKERPHTQIVDDFPPIYPLLSRVDLLLSDISSIGYDYLIFKKPLLILNPSGRDWTGKSSLLDLAQEIRPYQYNQLQEIIHTQLKSRVNQSLYQTFYEDTFCPQASLKSIKEDVFRLVKSSL